MVVEDLKQSCEYELYCSPKPIANPEISVIISTYNRCRKEGECESLLKRALDSILHQTFTDFELILIDDNSKDHTKEFCKQVALSDHRVKFFHFKENSGLPAKRYNFGISASRGKYLTFMFDDDQWEFNALETLHGEIQRRNDCGMVYGVATLYRGSDRSNPEALGDRWNWSIHVHNFIANNAVIVKRSVIDTVGGYDEHPVFLRICDWDLWWRIGRKFKVRRVKKKVAIVYSGLSDSLLVTKDLNFDACLARQRSNRVIPMQKKMNEPLKCRIKAAIFDTYGFFRRKLSIRRLLRRYLSKEAFQKAKEVYHYMKRVFKVK